MAITRGAHGEGPEHQSGPDTFQVVNASQGLESDCLGPNPTSATCYV